MKTVLHIINSSNVSEPLSKNTAAMIAAGDAVLFIENGVYLALANERNQALFGQLQAPVYALIPDLQARGLNQQALLDNVVSVDYEEFVDLTVSFDTSVSW